MGVTLVVHVVAGGLGIVLGFATLSVAKGGTRHRKIGILFVYAMLTMCVGGAVVALGRNVTVAINLPAALTTAYLVVTALITVRPFAGARSIGIGAMLVALGVGVTSLTFGFEAVVNGGAKDGIPAFPFFLFGVVGLAGGVSDVRILRSGPLTGAPRLARHLWRMCFALFIAAMSFFLGQADELPEALRIPPLLAIPILVPLLAMAYWLWRVRIKRSRSTSFSTSPALRRGGGPVSLSAAGAAGSPRARRGV